MTRQNSSSGSAATSIIRIWRNLSSPRAHARSPICNATTSAPGTPASVRSRIRTRGLDQFIGEPDMLDRGHGSAFIRAFADRLLANGAPRVVMDPDPANARAIRAYEKAGFERDRIVHTPDGPALLMVRDA